jgi:hypothetical protein
MYNEFLKGMNLKSLMNSIKDVPILIIALGLGILYLTVCLMDCILSRIQYYSKINFNRAKHVVFETLIKI